MKNRIIYIVGLILLLSIMGKVSAQVSQTQYFLGIPQANMANPAFRPSSNIYVGLPALSNLYLSVNNNMFKVNEMLQPMPGYDSTITILHPDYDLDSFLESLGNTGKLYVDASVQILGFGFTVSNDWYVDLSISQKANASAYIPADLFTLAFKGNESFIGSTINLSGLGAEAMQYMETSVGISKSINEKLRVGGRVKLLFGGVGAAIDNERLEIDVNEDLSHEIHSDLTLNVSGPLDFYLDEEGWLEDVEVRENINLFDILINSKNTGVAFDFGAEYQLLPNLSLSASIVDLGFIGWKSDVFNFKASNKFNFDVIDMTEVISGDKDIDDMMDELGDSLLHSFKPADGANRFNMGLPTKLFIGAQYRPIKSVGVGILSRTTFNEGHVSQALSLSGSFYAGDVFSTSLTYTMINRSYANLGLGFAVKAGPVQLYTIADQLPMTWVKFTESGGESGFAIPNRVDYITFRFGLNLLFGTVKQKAVDKPMLLE
jgi:hypothetical protein